MAGIAVNILRAPAVREAYKHIPDPIWRALEGAATEYEGLSQRAEFTPAHRQKLMGALVTKTRAEVEALRAQEVQRQAQAYDQEIGEARHAAKTHYDVPAYAADMARAALERQNELARLLRVTLARDAVQHLSAPEDLDLALADILLSDDADMIRTAGRGVVERASRLAREAAEQRMQTTNQTPAPIELMATRLASQYQNWAKANPTPAQRIRQAEQARASVTSRTDEAIGTFLQHIFGEHVGTWQA